MWEAQPHCSPQQSLPGSSVEKKSGGSREAEQTLGSHVSETCGHPAPRGYAPCPGMLLEVVGAPSC